MLPPPEPPEEPFTRQTVEKLGQCQTAIKEQGRTFVKTKLAKFEGCLDVVLNLQLKKENGYLNDEQFENKLEEARKTCANKFDQIKTASTKFVNRVVNKCEPVEEELLGENDALQFQAWQDEAGTGVPLESVEELAGFLCGLKEIAVDLIVGVQVPRKCHILEELGPEFGFADDEFCVPNIPLDERCPTFLDGNIPVSSKADPNAQRLQRLRDELGL